MGGGEVLHLCLGVFLAFGYIPLKERRRVKAPHLSFPGFTFTFYFLTLRVLYPSQKSVK